MFGEYLKAHGLSLSASRAPLFPPAEDRAAWAGIPAGFREEILRAASGDLGQPYPALSASQFLAFARAGDRACYEAPYFERRRRLIWAVLAECVQEDARHLDDVVDGMWCIMEESFWGVSAHNGSDHPGARPKEALPDIENPYIDLFAAQTASLLCLCCQLLGARLDLVSPLIVRRARLEVRRRVIEPFFHRDDFWWMGMIRRDLNNWTPWILSNVLLALLTFEEDEGRLAEGFARAMRMLDGYLAVVPADGGCDEGASYWNMAGGALLDCLELIRHATGGAADFYREPQIRNIARFPLSAHIEGEYFWNFADCDARPALDPERVYRFGERTSDAALMALGNQIAQLHPGLLSRDTPEFSRILNRLFRPLEHVSAAPPPAAVELPDLQVWARRRGALYVAFKGGHNGESHNHNDVGSFILYKGGRPFVIDLGNMRYSGKTFGPERYTLLNTRSRNHNLPLIGGMEQAAGSVYAAREVAFLGDCARMDIAGAYPREAGVLRLTRTLRLDDALCVTDHIELQSPREVQWVFMLRERPERLGECVRYDASLRVTLEEIPVEDPRMARNFPGSVWRLTFSAPAKAQHDQQFVFS